jgi:nucleotide-binding universal stress UspA family protein
VRAYCPVAITRLLRSPTQIPRIVVPVENLTPQAVQPVRFAQILAQSHQAQVTLLHVCGSEAVRDSALRCMTTSRRAWIESQLAVMASKWTPQNNLEIQITPHEDVVRAILNTVQSSDLIVLRSKRLRTAGGLAISDITTQLVQQLTCSVVML